MVPWKVIDRVQTPQGVLELRQRSSTDFLITIARKTRWLT
jgi:hypothetical protein